YKTTLESDQSAKRRIHRPVGGNVVTVIAQERREKRHHPNRRNAEFLKVIELLRQATEVTISVAAAVVKRADVDLINNRVLVPKPVLCGQAFCPQICIDMRC